MQLFRSEGFFFEQVHSIFGTYRYFETKLKLLVVQRCLPSLFTFDPAKQ